MFSFCFNVTPFFTYGCFTKINCNAFMFYSIIFFWFSVLLPFSNQCHVLWFVLSSKTFAANISLQSVLVFYKKLSQPYLWSGNILKDHRRVSSLKLGSIIIDVQQRELHCGTA